MKRRLWFGIVLLGLLLCGCQSKEEKAAELYRRVEAYMASSQWEGADKALDEILALFPQDVNAYSMKLQAYTERKNKSKIEETCRSILAIDKHHDAAIEGLSRIYYDEGRKEEAFTILQNASSGENLGLLEKLADEKLTSLQKRTPAEFDIQEFFRLNLLKFKKHGEEVAIGCALFQLLSQVGSMKSAAISMAAKAFVASHLDSFETDVDEDSLAGITQGYRLARLYGEMEYKTCDELIEKILYMNSMVTSVQRMAREQAGKADSDPLWDYGAVTIRNKIFLETAIKAKLARIH